MLPELFDRTALVVEDQPLIAQLLADELHALGFGNVFTAFNLQSAEARIELNRIDFALLDLNLGLGELSLDLGISLARAGVYVAFVSGYAKADLGPAMQDFNFLEKPVGRDDILNLLRKVFGRTDGRRTAAE